MFEKALFFQRLNLIVLRIELFTVEGLKNLKFHVRILKQTIKGLINEAYELKELIFHWAYIELCKNVD